MHYLVAYTTLAGFDHVQRRHAQDVHNSTHLVFLIDATKQRFSYMHLYQHAAKRPHIDLMGILQTEKYLWRSIEPALYV
jgi:hypothetical protein